ncbi:retrotransposon protein, putative, ty1-copia subclass [Tanacetum coccineum]
MDFREFYKELEAEVWGSSAKLMGLQLLQLELRLGKTPSRSFRPVKSAEILWQFWASSSFGVSLAHDGSLSKSTDVMMAATQTINNNSIRSILEKDKLNGSNFLNWYRNLRIILRNEQKLPHIGRAYLKAYCHCTAAVRHRPTPVEVVHALQWEEAASVQHYCCLKIESLLGDYDQFVQNYNMHGMGKTIPELHAMLKLTEKAQDPPPAKKGASAQGTSAYPLLSQELTLEKWNVLYYFGRVIRRNKANASDTSGIFTIELFSFPKSNSWIYDTGCGTYIYNTIQGLRGYRKLNKGALDLYVGNGNTTAVEAIGSFDLILPSGMILVLDNCHFSPTITRGVISLSRLWDNGFRHKFMDNGAISVSKDNICYFNAFPRDGIFEIDMHNHISNERSIYTCSNKKTKHNLDSTFLWHCRLGHINKKRIEKLQHDGLLKSIDDESFDVCVSCISGKMARKPFTHASERADDLLGIIHSDVCGPFRTTSREGANYYVTFTDDFSRYGYVYLIKHKHEVFEMFKTFQNEVENQLGKTIKALQSDRGGEYLSQEFLDHLRSRGIISQLTPPYTPQHNGVSERRNRTLLDMVRSMMSLTTLAISTRIPQAPERYSFYIDDEDHELGDHGEPPNYRAALSDLESEKWLEAMNAKMQSMKDNQVWNFVDLLPNCKTVGSKWLFKKKTDMDDPTGWQYTTYKARLMLSVDWKSSKQKRTTKQMRLLNELNTYAYANALTEACNGRDTIG